MPHSDITPVVTPTKPLAAAFTEAKEHTPEKAKDQSTSQVLAALTQDLSLNGSTLTEEGQPQPPHPRRHTDSRAEFEFERARATTHTHTGEPKIGRQAG